MAFDAEKALLCINHRVLHESWKISLIDTLNQTLRNDGGPGITTHTCLHEEKQELKTTELNIHGES